MKHQHKAHKARMSIGIIICSLCDEMRVTVLNNKDTQPKAGSRVDKIEAQAGLMELGP